MQNNMEILKVTLDEINKIISTREWRGMFYCISEGRCVGCDNRTGDAWTEDFKSPSACKRWLEQRKLFWNYLKCLKVVWTALRKILEVEK